MRSISISGLTMLQRCGTQFEFRYVKGMRRPPGVAAAVGTAVDAAVTLDLEHKIERGSLIEQGFIEAAAADSIQQSWAEGIDIHEDDPPDMGPLVDKAVRLASMHHRRVAPQIVPISVQKTFALDLSEVGADLTLTGKIDVEEPDAIRDTKTSAKSPQADAAETSEQLTCYALGIRASNPDPVRVALDYLVDSKIPGVKTLESRRGPADYERLIRRVQQAEIVIQSGAFQPTNPDNWWCSKKWCGYWDVCPFARRRVQV